MSGLIRRSIIVIVLLAITGLYPVRAEDAEITIHSIPESADVRVNGILRGKCPVLLIARIKTVMQLELSTENAGSCAIDYTVTGNDTVIIDVTSCKRITGAQYRDIQEGKSQTETLSNTPLPKKGEISVVEKAPEPDSSEQPKPVLVKISKPRRIPANLKKNNVRGSANYRIFLDHRGRVQNTEAVQISEIDGLDNFIKKWTEKWEFQPATLNGFPVSSFLNITIKYDFPQEKFQAVGFENLQQGFADSASNAETQEEPPPKAVAEPAPTATPEPIPPTPAPAPAQDNLPAVECADKSSVNTPPTIIQPPKIGAIPISIQNLNKKGSGVFRVKVLTDGTVGEVQVSKSTGSDILDEWIMPSLKETIWEPATSNGSALACWREVKLSYYTLACRFDFPDIFN